MDEEMQEEKTEEVWLQSAVKGTEHLLVSNLGRIKFPAYVDSRGHQRKERITFGSRHKHHTGSYYRVFRTRGEDYRVHKLVCFSTLTSRPQIRCTPRSVHLFHARLMGRPGIRERRSKEPLSEKVACLWDPVESTSQLFG